MTSLLNNKNAVIPATIVGTAVGCYLFSFLKRTFGWKDLGKLKDCDIKINKKDFKKDVVYVYSFAKIQGIHASPFVHKLLAFLQYANIPYEVVKGDHMGKTPRSKLPFIELNGQVITDSHIIVSFLSSYFKTNIDADLSDSEKGVSLSVIRLLEEHYYFTMVYYRWKHPEGWNKFLALIPAPGFIKTVVGPILRAKVATQLMSQGMGRHNDDTVVEFAREDLKAVSDILGDNEFFFGKSKPHLVDIVLYSALACQDHAIPTPHYQIISEFPNLISHKKRMQVLIPINGSQ